MHENPYFQGMFVVIYQFDVRDGKEDDFKTAWKALTELILKFENSLGSRLHHENGQRYIAYAQWHSKEQWENAGNNLPEEAAKFRETMKYSCTNIQTIHTLKTIDDLLLTKS